MEYRRLGRTERQVSLLGVGGGYVMLHDLEAGTQLYQRAYELGVNYFDGRYGYSSTMQRPVIKQNREFFVVGTKTASTTREKALERIDEDLKELDTDYLDIFYLRTYTQEMMDEHLAPGGSMEGLLEAKKQGRIRAIALAGHTDLNALARGVETGLVDVVEFPLNIARREAYDVLIPAMLKHDVGMVIMKPMNVGLAPAGICLPWLANQTMHVMCPGMSTIDHLELDAAVLDRHPMALTPEEEAEVERWRQKTQQATCHICDRVCQPVCEPRINIDWQIYHNVYQNELRRLGVQGFMAYPFAAWFKKNAEATFTSTLASLNTCTKCGKCEEACSTYHLPIIAMIDEIKVQQAELVEALKKANWSGENEQAASPLPANSLPTAKKARKK
jgi:uncharacterized protein